MRKPITISGDPGDDANLHNHSRFICDIQ